MHDKGIIHGDLKGVCFFNPIITLFVIHPLTGKYPSRQQWLRPFNGFQSGHYDLGPDSHRITTNGGRDNSLDEPRALAPGKVRFERQLPDLGIRSLRAGDGDVRSSQREGAIFQV